MIKQPQISIILCTLNEAGNILDLLDSISCQFTDFEIVLVDDNSSDGTFRLALEYAQTHPFLRPYQRVGITGLGGALQSGINLARGGIICWLDADFSHPVTALKKMVDHLIDDQADVVVASRFIPGSKDFTAQNSRLVGLQKKMGLLLARTGKLLLHPEFHDWSSGFIALRRRCLDGVRLSGDHGEYFMELIFHCYQRNFRVREIPFISPPRRSGKSKTASNLFGLAKHGPKYAFKLAKLSFLKFRQGRQAYEQGLQQ